MTTKESIWAPVYKALQNLPTATYDPDFTMREDQGPTKHQLMWDEAMQPVFEAFKIFLRQEEALTRVDLQELQTQYKAEIQKAKTKTQAIRKIAVSISPELRESPDACFKIIEVLKKSTLSVAWHKYTIEQRSETMDFDGFHLHLSGETQEYPADVKYNLKRLLNGKKGKPMANSDVKFANDNWETQYMAGNKTDKDPEKQRHKQAAALMDIEMRKKYNLPTIIEWLPSND